MADNLYKRENIIMKQFISLKNSLEFGNVYKRGKSYANKYLVMYIVDNNLEVNRLGISVSKKVGNSVVRHRTTRLIRETYRLHQDELVKGKDIVVVARVNSKGRNYWDIESAFLHLARLHHIISSGSGDIAQKEDNN
jgi:ribonuclease P protein component